MTYIAALATVMLAAAAISGRPVVVDGDTITLDGERVRLWGIDAPEGRQTCSDASHRETRCGDFARAYLRQLTNGGVTICKPRDRDIYGRLVSVCRVGRTDLGYALVRAGWAVDYTQYSGGYYAAAERDAKTAKRGVWAGEFERPSVWRQNERTPAGPPSPPPKARCAIKGNINAEGRHIFHVPGQRDYAATVIDATKGERWFCSHEEAVRAGWVPAQR